MSVRRAWAAASPPLVDQALVERVLAETRVQSDLPDPSWTEYGGVLADALRGWIAETLSPLSAAALGDSVKWIAAALTAGVLSALVLLAGRTLVRALRRPPPEHAGAAVGVEAPAAAEKRHAESWRAELERRLAGGDVAGALEALWWWLACTLARQADPSWTTRELLGRVARRDLLPLGRRLDRMLYGPAAPSADEVRGLLGRLERALA